jgi:hypothetical protein
MGRENRLACATLALADERRPQYSCSIRGLLASK